MRESSSSLAALRQRVARLADSGAPSGGGDGGWLASGHADFDAAIGGGLAIGKTHEFFAADALDATSAAAFAALLALRTPGAAQGISMRPASPSLAATPTGCCSSKPPTPKCSSPAPMTRCGAADRRRLSSKAGEHGPRST